MTARFTIAMLDDTKILSFDTWFEESFKRSNDVPTQPLEDGKFAADNKRKNPATFDVIASKCQASNKDSDIQNTMDELDKLASAPGLVKVYSKYKIYKNLTLIGWSYINSSEDYGLQVSLSFKEVAVVRRQYSNAKGGQKAKKTPTVNKGIQQTKAPEPSQKTQTQSAISKFSKGWKL